MNDDPFAELVAAALEEQSANNNKDPQTGADDSNSIPYVVKKVVFFRRKSRIFLVPCRVIDLSSSYEEAFGYKSASEAFPIKKEPASTPSTDKSPIGAVSKTLLGGKEGSKGRKEDEKKKNGDKGARKAVLTKKA